MCIRDREGYREAGRIGNEIGDRQLIALNRCKQGEVLLGAGRLEEAAEALDEGLAIYEEMKAERTTEYFQFKGVQAKLAAKRGDPAAARARAVEALEVADHLGLKEDHPAPGIRAGLVELKQLLER